MWLLVLTAVLRVVDGDTVHVLDHGRDVDVRVLRIDCPESKRNARCRRKGAEACEAELPKGRAAKEYAETLLHPGDVVTLVDVRGHDRYGRTLAKLRLRDGRDFGEIMLREGGCAPYVHDRVKDPRLDVPGDQ